MIKKDDIAIPHEIRFGVPTPSENFCRDGDIIFFEEGSRITLDDFPRNVMPSGGMSCVLSESEMFAVRILYSYRLFLDTTTHMYFYRWEYGKKKQIAHNEGLDFAEDPRAGPYRVFYFAFVGRYDWEISQPGLYSCEIETVHGSAEIEFEVI